MKTHTKFRGINLGTMQPCSTKKYNPGCQSFFKLFCIRRYIIDKQQTYH